MQQRSEEPPEQRVQRSVEENVEEPTVAAEPNLAQMVARYSETTDPNQLEILRQQIVERLRSDWRKILYEERLSEAESQAYRRQDRLHELIYTWEPYDQGSGRLSKRLIITFINDGPRGQSQTGYPGQLEIWLFPVLQEEVRSFRYRPLNTPVRSFLSRVAVDYTHIVNKLKRRPIRVIYPPYNPLMPVPPINKFIDKKYLQLIREVYQAFQAELEDFGQQYFALPPPATSQAAIDRLPIAATAPSPESGTLPVVPDGDDSAT